MADVRARDAAIRRELGVPPAFDLVAHVRNLARVLLPALVVALIVGGAVYAVRASGTPLYESDIVAEVQSGAQVVVTDANLGQVVAPYVALATDSEVVASIQGQIGNGWTTADVSQHISVTPGTSPSLVFVKATAFSQEESDRLARIVVSTLSDAQARRNADALDRRTKVLSDDIERLNGELARSRGLSSDDEETSVNDPTVQADLDARVEQLRALRSAESGSDRLQLLAAPSGSGEPVAPKPLVESAVVFLVALILAAEILAACRGRFGSRVTDAWARRTAAKFGTSILVQHSATSDIPPNVALTINQRASLGDHVLVLLGDDVPPESLRIPENVASRVSKHRLNTDWWSRIDSHGTAFALVVVSAQSADQREIVECLRALAEVDIVRSLVLVGPAAPEPIIDTITLAAFRRGRDGSATARGVNTAKPSTDSDGAMRNVPRATRHPVPDRAVREPVRDVAVSEPVVPERVEVPWTTPETTDESSVDLLKKNQVRLLDAETVSIPRNELPNHYHPPVAHPPVSASPTTNSAAPNSAFRGGADVDGNEKGEVADVEDAPVAFAGNDDEVGAAAPRVHEEVSSDSSTGRIMLTSKDIAAIRRRRETSRSSPVHPESVGGASESRGS